MGGSALALSCLLENTPAGNDPSGPENPPAVTPAGDTRAPIAVQSRSIVVAESAVTDGGEAGWDPATGSPIGETLDAPGLAR
jgi:hypothetical protein